MAVCKMVEELCVQFDLIICTHTYECAYICTYMYALSHNVRSRVCYESEFCRRDRTRLEEACGIGSRDRPVEAFSLFHCNRIRYSFPGIIILLAREMPRILFRARLTPAAERSRGSLAGREPPNRRVFLHCV